MDDLTFESILADCGLSMIDFLGDGANDAFVKIHGFLTALHTDVTTKVVTADDESDEKPAYEQAWIDDEQAKAEALSIAKNIVQSLEFFEDSPSMVYNLRAAVTSIVSKYLTTEVEFRRWEAERNEPNVNVSRNTRNVNAQRYQVGKAGLVKLFGLIGHNLSVPTDLLKSDGKSLVPNLPEMRGNYGGQNGNATGLNAKLYRLSYIVNDESFDDPRLALRAIWRGADRAGKTTSNLMTAIDLHAKSVWSDDSPVTFTLDGNEVTVQRVAK